jgi:FlaA1/EpsC-like NDP-sugar epimerase
VFSEPRAGEKLFEDLLTAEEGIDTTQNKKIFIAKMAQIKGGRLGLVMKKLEKAAHNGDKKTITKTLKDFISSYKS